MEKNFKQEIIKLNEYKIKHQFNYEDIAGMLNVTTRSLRRWLKGEYIPLPIYQDKIIQLIGSKNRKV